MESLSLPACRAVLTQRIIFQPKTCIIQQGWLGSSAQNSPSSAFALRWERVKGEVVQQQLPSATSLLFFAYAKKGGDHTNQIWSMNDFFMDRPYYTLCTQHSFPPSPVKKTCEGVPGRPQLPSGAVISCNLTEAPIGLETSLSWPPSSLCRVRVSKPGRVWVRLYSACLRRLVLALVSVV